MVLDKGQLEELCSGEEIEVYLQQRRDPCFKVHKKLLGHFAPHWSELFDVMDLQRIDLEYADDEGATWLHKWLEAGGKDKAGEDLDTDTADSNFVDELISNIVAAMDLRVNQAKDDALSTLYKVLDKKRFTDQQLMHIRNITSQGFGDDLLQAAIARVIISLLESADCYLHAELHDFACSNPMERTLDSQMIIGRVKAAQCFKPLPVHKLRFLYEFMPTGSRLRPVIAADLWRLIQDGKVQGIESYYYFAEEEDAFNTDMKRAFEYHRLQYGHDTPALQVTWNEQVGALKEKAMADLMTENGHANHIRRAGIDRRSRGSRTR